MSGIVGIINLNGEPVDGDLLERMTEFMSFRGPDAQDIWTDGHVGFGHTMLRTTDESSNEKQPFSSEGQVWITADARIDGRKDLIQKLEPNGRGDLKADTDVDLILHAYQVWGEDLWISLVEAPDLYAHYTVAWDNNEYGLNMEGARRIAINIWSKERIKPEQLLVKPQCWATLDYATIENYDASSKVNWVIDRGGRAHGLGVWFDSDLIESVNISNAPGDPEHIYGNAFFPLLKPVDITKGDTIDVGIIANLVGEDYIWCWNFTVLSEGNPQKIIANFKQSSFFATPLSSAMLRKVADNHVPALNENGQIDRFIISMMDGNASLGDIAHQVMKKFPNRFSRWYDALTYVGKLSEKYSR